MATPIAIGWYLLPLGLALWITWSMIQRVTVLEYEHVVHFRRGKLADVLNPGAHWFFRPWTTLHRLDARTSILTVPGQELLSADGVSFKVSLLLEHKVVDPKAAVLESSDYLKALYAKAQDALRAAIVNLSIEEMLESREQLAKQLSEALEPAARELGVELERASVKDLMFSGPLKEAFSLKARARQEAQASLERARGESSALRHLANTARLMDGNPGLFNLRLLQTAAESGKLVLTVAPAEGTPGLPETDD